MLLTLTACKKEDLTQGGPYWGTVTAKKNGQDWSGKIRGTQQNDLLGLIIDKHNSEGDLREDLYFDRIPQFIGVYNVPKTDTLRKYDFVTSGYFTLQDDGDVIEGVYYVCPCATNFVNIQSVNQPPFGVYKGTFGITFVVEPSSKTRHPYLPDTIVFSNGQFETKILIKL